MFTIRNIGGASLFLLGTTFLWMTPAFASAGISTTGRAWAAANVLSLAALLGFTIATWGLFDRTGWWEAVAVASALVGIVAALAFWVAAEHAGEPAPAFNAAIHLLGSAGVLLLLLVPALERWATVT